MGVKYVMVTFWRDYWNNLKEREAHYTKTMIKNFEVNKDNLVEYALTLFIKREERDGEAGPPEKAWVGYVYEFNFEKEPSKIFFKVNTVKEVPLSQVPEEYLSLEPGWYIKDWDLKGEVVLSECSLYPDFFYSLFITKNWEEFEEHVFKLLKLLGIHTIHRFKDQKGKSDGFFIFRNLAVIYDCTLNENFEEEKAQQIKNYYGQLESGWLKYGEKYYYPISNRRKQIWIISRGKPRLIKQIGDVEVKEVPMQALINIYAKRLKENLDEMKLEEELIHVSSNP